MEPQKNFSIAGFSPLRVAYALDVVLIGIVPACFFDAYYYYLSAIWGGALVLCVLITFQCILVPWNTHHRFLPVAFGSFGFLAFMICAPL